MIGRTFKALRPYKRSFGIAYTVTGIYCACKLFNEHLYEFQASSGPSMYPTIHFKGDWLLISKLHKYGQGIDMGDIIAFKHPILLRSEAAKRVIGLPGDYVLRNSPIDEVEGADKGGEAEMIQVPEAHVWVSGDNLPWSRDSKDYGPIPMGLILGKVVGKAWWPFQFEWFNNPYKQPVVSEK